MKKAVVLALGFLFIGIFCMSFLFDKKTAQEENATAQMGKELAYNANEDSIKVVNQSANVQSELDKINQEMNALEEDVTTVHENCNATYYHDRFNGKRTASGKVFSNRELTAAHKTLPFGTKVRVTNLKNDESVIVTITDRGPFVKGKTIDLSKKAFMEITHNRGTGHLDVKVEVLPEGYIDEYEDLSNEKEALAFVKDSLKNKTFEL